MPEPPEVPLPERIETIQSSFCLELQPLWQWQNACGDWSSALADPWGTSHRPDWHARGLIIWPRGGSSRVLRLTLRCPEPWQQLAGSACGRLALRWWAEALELRVDGTVVHRGDLFDSACRWPLPERWWQGQSLELELTLRSPRHDDGALVMSRLELEPLDPGDPHGLLEPQWQQLSQLQQDIALPSDQPRGLVHVLGHAHLDLAWLWPVADTWEAAVRTFDSVLDLMERFGALHFAHSTPALYAWLQAHRPALFARLEAAVAAGRFEPINGPWVETDCVLISTSSLLRQFQLGQQWSRAAFPQLSHELAWLPDSFGFAAGLPAIAGATGVRWFCTHKLAWNATNPFPHRLFRWRSRCGDEVLALMTAAIGTDGDPIAIERYRRQWQHATGLGEALWLPGVGDHGGGPTAEMLEQLALWQVQAERGAPLAPQRHGSLRQYLSGLEPHASALPVWRDELYLELHRGCATSRPDQKRHNRTLERLLREAELAQMLAACSARAELDPAEPSAGAPDWRPLLFQQFHDILPGTSIPEVFEQAEGQWRSARRQARAQRDAALQQWLSPLAASAERWAVVQLQPLETQGRCVRLPAGAWSLGDEGQALPAQPAAAGGCWLQLPALSGTQALPLQRLGCEVAKQAAAPAPVHPVVCQELAGGRWRLGNGLLSAEIGPAGLEQLSDAAGRAYLLAPAQLRRYRDAGEFWDAWDLAADYAAQPCPIAWQHSFAWIERGPLCVQLSWRGRLGSSAVRLDARLQAASPWLELLFSIDWRQQHELLRFEVPLAQDACRWASDTSGGVIERPAQSFTVREQARWEVPAISWLASEAAAPGGGLGVLLDGPQGVSASPKQLGVSLLRAPTWPDPSADNGWQRLRLALTPCPAGWRLAALPQRAVQFREPLWCRPLRLEPRPDADQVGRATALVTLPALGPDLLLLGARHGVITVQNLSSCRRHLDLGPSWQLIERLDGLDRRLDGAEVDGWLRPWQIGCWRIVPAGR